MQTETKIIKSHFCFA